MVQPSGAIAEWGSIRSGRDGTAEFPHAQLESLAVAAGTDVGSTSVRAHVVGAAPVTMSVPAGPGRHDLEMEICATGRLCVILETTPGDPYPAIASVRVLANSYPAAPVTHRLRGDSELAVPVCVGWTPCGTSGVNG